MPDADELQTELTEFLRLIDEKHRLEELTKANTEARAQAERVLRDRFERIGVQNLKTTDGRTVYLSRELYAGARAGDRLAVTRALHEIGLDDLVKESFHAGTLSAYIRELDAREEEIPPELAAVIDVAELYRVRVRGR